MKKNINSYKNGILHEWMTARISFVLTLPFCRDNEEKQQTLTDHEKMMLDNVYGAYGANACDYAAHLLDDHPFFQSWKELEKISSDMDKGSVYLPRAVYDAARADIIALNRAGLAEVYTSQCGEGVCLNVYACAQVRRKIERIFDDAREYVRIVNGFKEV